MMGPTAAMLLRYACLIFGVNLLLLAVYSEQAARPGPAGADRAINAGGKSHGVKEVSVLDGQAVDLLGLDCIRPLAALQPVNSLRYPAFTGFDPNLFFQPNRVNIDNLDFGPAFGCAWAPSPASGWLGKRLGNHQTVWRGGYQISYDPLYTQILSLDLATSTPNAITIDQHATSTTGRGVPNWLESLPAGALRPPSLLDTATHTHTLAPVRRTSIGSKAQDSRMPLYPRGA